MRKILLIAKRDYLAAVRTKAFVFGLIIAPVLFGSGFVVVGVMRARPDIADRRVVLLDHTGVAAPLITDAVTRANQEQLSDKSGRQVMPRYTLETEAARPPEVEEQRLQLSDQVRTRKLFAFIEIGPDVLTSGSGLTWYSNEGGPAEGRQWLSAIIGDAIVHYRLAQSGMDSARIGAALKKVSLDSMNLVQKDPRTGHIESSGRKNEAAAFLVPFLLAFLLFMVVMGSAAPMMPAIAEDKMQRVFEMLLASATAFELIAGKVLAAVAVSLTSSTVYILAALFALNALSMFGVAPLAMIPWFLLYLIAEVVVLASIATALGAASGSPQAAQSLGIILFAPVIIPMMMLTPVLQRPDGAFAATVSLIPPFTPMLMLTRQALPAGVPAWQISVGILGVVLFSVLTAWVAARIFRVALLVQGKPPNLPEILRWAIRG
ncbi:MAG TPA: ABC transporter permease [Bryobacteraceae bacterium]|nr:ABC transporter permease [Bryobacteraceae bacterium]